MQFTGIKRSARRCERDIVAARAARAREQVVCETGIRVVLLLLRERNRVEICLHAEREEYTNREICLHAEREEYTKSRFRQAS